MSEIYLDGQFLAPSEARFGPTLFSLNYAVCAFEGIRCYSTAKGPAIFRLDAHLERYRSTCDFLSLESPYLDIDALADAICELVSRSDNHDLYIRPLAFIDEGIMQLGKPPAVKSCIFALPLKSPVDFPVIRLGIAGKARSLDTISRKISRNYLDPYLGLKCKPADVDDLLFLDADGFVTETSAHNIFFIMRDGTAVTPRTSHCLPGITRDCQLKLLVNTGIHVEERNIHVDELASVSACFTTSTASETRIVAAIGPHSLDSNNEIVHGLAEEYRRNVIGKSEINKEWNHYV